MHKVYVTKLGMKKLYGRYIAGKLPMIKSWDGKYYFAK